MSEQDDERIIAIVFSELCTPNANSAYLFIYDRWIRLNQAFKNYKQIFIRSIL